MLERRLCIAILAMLSIVGCAHAMSNARVDTDDRYPYVVQVGLGYTQYSQVALCSGWMYRPQVLVLSAHCLINSVNGKRMFISSIKVLQAGRLRSYPGTIVLNTHILKAAETALLASKPEATFGHDDSSLHQYDIAAVSLREPIDVPLPTTIFDYVPLKDLAADAATASGETKKVHSEAVFKLYGDAIGAVVRNALKDGWQVGTTVAVGFGGANPGCKADCIIDGKRRYKDGALAPFEKCQIWPPYYPATAFWWCTVLDGTEHGDSGGPLLLKMPDGRQAVVGVTDNGTQKGFSVFASVFTAAYLIDEAMKEVEAYPSPQSSPVPVPAPLSGPAVGPAAAAPHEPSVVAPVESRGRNKSPKLHRDARLDAPCGNGAGQCFLHCIGRYPSGPNQKGCLNHCNSAAKQCFAGRLNPSRLSSAFQSYLPR